jgi:U4/U6.U5 tri-snRNP component SNU23
MSPADKTDGRTQIINPTTELAGFKCELCEATFPSYSAYVEHCNGRLHQRNLGATPVERVDDVARIKARLLILKEQKHRGRTKEDVERHVETRIAQRKLEEEEQRRRKRQSKKGAKKREEKEEGEEQPVLQDEESQLMASVLGIKSFK